MITVGNLTKKFDKTLFKDLNLTINEGEIAAVIGPSGGGKTTLLNIIMGLDKDYIGRVQIEPGKRFSVVFQEDRLLEDKTVAGNLKAVCADEGKNREIAAALKLADAFNKPIGELSGGMKRRVALARALVFDGDIFIFDELFKGIDLGLKQEILQLLKASLKGKTCIFVSHSVSEVMALAQRIIILDSGKIVKDLDRKTVRDSEDLKQYLLDKESRT